MLPDESSCEDLIATGTTIKGDSDISGIGVILAFTLSAYVTFVTVLCAYFFGHVERRLLNRVDIHILRIQPSSPTRNRRITICLRQAILALSDQQIVTGIAILAAGFHGLSNNNITTYHFQIVLYLAWMSSSVHLSALGFLRGFLSRNKPLLAWRIVGMLVLMILLFVGFVPTVSNDWGIQDPYDETDENLTGWGIPAACFFGRLYGDGINPDAILSFLLLVVSYAWKAGGQFQSIRSPYSRYVRSPVEWFLESSLAIPAKRYARTTGAKRLFWLWIYRLALAVYIPIDSVIEISASFSASIWVSLLGLVYGTMQIFIPRSQVLYMTSQTESGWSFGQLVPLILLIQPLGAIMEHLGKKAEGTPPPKTEQVTPSQTDLVQRQTREYGETLLHFLANFKPTPPAERHDETSDLYPFLFESKLFATQIWLTQGSTVGIATTVFVFDTYTIGNITAENWNLILFFMSGYTGVTFLLILALAPFSRLGCRKSSLCPGPTINLGCFRLRILARQRVQTGLEKLP